MILFKKATIQIYSFYLTVHCALVLVNVYRIFFLLGFRLEKLTSAFMKFEQGKGKEIEEEEL